jgi:hypothetical protein
MQNFCVGSMFNVIPVRKEFYDYLQITKQLFWIMQNLHFLAILHIM